MNTCQIQCNVSPFVRPDEARDGRNVALNLTSVHGVLDCPKKNQAITYPACLITSTKGKLLPSLIPMQTHTSPAANDRAHGGLRMRPSPTQLASYILFRPCSSCILKGTDVQLYSLFYMYIHIAVYSTFLAIHK